jgi:hypothetical protein
MAMTRRDYKMISDCIADNAIYTFGMSIKSQQSVEKKLMATADSLATCLQEAGLSFKSAKFLERAYAKNLSIAVELHKTYLHYEGFMKKNAAAVPNTFWDDVDILFWVIQFAYWIEIMNQHLEQEDTTD